MYYPFRQDGNAKEQPMLNPSGPTVLDRGNTGRAFGAAFPSEQTQVNPGGFHHGGLMPAMHNVPANYNLQSMQNALSSRSSNMALPSSASQQPSGNPQTLRFPGSNIPGGMPQMSHTGLHGQNTLGSRGGLNAVGSHPFTSGMNGIVAGSGQVANAPGSSIVVGNSRAALGSGLGGLNSGQLGGAGGHLAATGSVNMSNTGGMNVGGGASGIIGGGSSNINRNLANVGALNLSALNSGSRGLGGGGLGSLGTSSIQGPGRPAGLNMLQQGVNLPSSFTASGDVLAMLSRAAAVRKNPAVNAVQQQNAEFTMQNEDFPALPNFKAGGNGDFGLELHNHRDQHDALTGLEAQHFANLNGSQAAARMRGPGAKSGLGQLEHFVSQHQQNYQQQHASSQMRVGGHQQPNAAAAGGSLAGKEAGQRALHALQNSPDRFGLLGLLSVIRMTEADLTTLALGTDLTTLGLNLNSRENLYKTFASPWAEGPARGEPEFTLPQCYVQAAPKLQPGYFAKFQQDTLFYIFYSMPNDEAQLYAADELCNRGWCYHKEHQMWFTRVPNTEALVKTTVYERGSFFFFDPTVWETGRKDNFVLQYDLLEARPQLPPALR